MARIEVWARDLWAAKWPEEPLYVLRFDTGPEDIKDVKVEFYDEDDRYPHETGPDRIWSL